MVIDEIERMSIKKKNSKQIKSNKKIEKYS